MTDQAHDRAISALLNVNREARVARFTASVRRMKLDQVYLEDLISRSTAAYFAAVPERPGLLHTTDQKHGMLGHLSATAEVAWEFYDDMLHAIRHANEKVFSRNQPRRSFSVEVIQRTQILQTGHARTTISLRVQRTT